MKTNFLKIVVEKWSNGVIYRSETRLKDGSYLPPIQTSLDGIADIGISIKGRIENESPKRKYNILVLKGAFTNTDNKTITVCEMMGNRRFIIYVDKVEDSLSVRVVLDGFSNTAKFEIDSVKYIKREDSLDRIMYKDY